MPDLKDQNELDAYYLADSGAPRAAGVMWPAIIEKRIDALFTVGLRPDAAVHNELFQPSGAIGNYAVKVRLAYMLGWIGKDVYDDLLLVARIRNRFAHVLEATDFTDQKVAAWLGNMKVHKLLPDMLESAKERAEADPSVESLVMADVIKDAIEDGQMGFRFCLDMMLHHLDKCYANMERNLANLPEDWATSDEPTRTARKPSEKS
ncbi:MAG: MltR family transcriptional regulator [Kiloniellaceae bacterium]